MSHDISIQLDQKLKYVCMKMFIGKYKKKKFAIGILHHINMILSFNLR